jgi:CubicO group peptidase (beta-lactamase class C family)
LKNVSVAALLRHEAGLPNWRNFYVRGDDLKSRDWKDVISQAATNRQCSQANVYSDLGPILLTKLLEVTYEASFEIMFKKLCFDDLNLDPALTLGPGWSFRRDQCVPTGYCQVRERELIGEVHDENAWALGGFTGHSGLFGSLRMFLDFVRAFCQSRLGRIVLQQNIDWALRYPSSDSALGWRTGRDKVSGLFGSGHAIGHYGFTGTSFWLNPVDYSFSIVLTNRVKMARTSNLPAMRDFRSQVYAQSQAYINQCSNKA